MKRILIDTGGDYSNSFQRLRSVIANSQGTPYIDFVKTLSPHYGRLFLDIGLGYAALLLTCVLVVALPENGVMPGWLAAGLGALLIGFWVAYLQLFIHFISTSAPIVPAATHFAIC
jgi:hypothetical protein